MRHKRNLHSMKVLAEVFKLELGERFVNGHVLLEVLGVAGRDEEGIKPLNQGVSPPELDMCKDLPGAMIGNLMLIHWDDLRRVIGNAAVDSTVEEERGVRGDRVDLRDISVEDRTGDGRLVCWYM
jgi:hypothetical protein